MVDVLGRCGRSQPLPASLQVHRGRHRSTHQEVALKEMFLTEQKALPLHVERELQLLRAVSHPNILPLQGVYSKVGLQLFGGLQALHRWL